MNMKKLMYIAVCVFVASATNGVVWYARSMPHIDSIGITFSWVDAMGNAVD